MALRVTERNEENYSSDGEWWRSMLINKHIE
jgi:hypothetical protein